MSSKEKDTENSNEQLDEKDKEILEIEKKLNVNKIVNNEKVEENNTKEEEKIENQAKDEVQEKQKTKKEHNKKMWLLSTILTICIVALVFSTIFALLNLGKGTIARGVSIKGIDVSNLTVAEATQKITEAINVELLLGLEMRYGEEYKFDFDASQIQYSYDIKNAVKQAYGIGKSENIIVNNYELLYTAFAGQNIELESLYNEE